MSAARRPGEKNEACNCRKPQSFLSAHSRNRAWTLIKSSQHINFYRLNTSTHHHINTFAANAEGTHSTVSLTVLPLTKDPRLQKHEIYDKSARKRSVGVILPVQTHPLGAVCRSVDRWFSFNNKQHEQLFLICFRVAPDSIHIAPPQTHCTVGCPTTKQVHFQHLRIHVPKLLVFLLSHQKRLRSLMSS